MTKDDIDRAAALSKSAGVLTFYCDNTDCAGREVVVNVKDDDGTLVAQLARSQTCPLCGKALETRGVATIAQYDANAAHTARCSVNTQMYVRDQGGAAFVPGSVYLDDRLPPTPEGWWTPAGTIR
jgi:hypothetical protein